MKSTIGLIVAAVVGIAILDQAAGAGVVAGPKIRSECVEPYGTECYPLDFRAGEPAHVALRGRGDTNLDLYIYDEQGNLVASDADGSDVCAVEWCPRRTGAFVIRVVNRGPTFIEYQIVTN